MNRSALVLAFVMSLAVITTAVAAQAVNGASFVLVATESSGTQLFELTSDAAGKIYVGNNSNNSIGIPVKLFDPALFTGTPLVFQSFGPSLGDADGIAFGSGFIYAASSAGVERITVPGGVGTLFMPGVATNGTGSPIVVRPADGHIFVGLGGLTGINRIDEYTAAGTFVASHTTGTDVETMTFDPVSGKIYYAPFGSQVRALNPVTNADVAVGASSGTIDGGLTFDSLSGLLFVGTANGLNSGLVETIDPATGTRKPFASGFNGSLGILREPVSGDLYFLEASQLYRLPSALVSGALAPPSITKVFGAATIPLNGATSLTFTITNQAQGSGSLTGIGFTDTMPAGLIVTTPNGLIGSCGSGTITATAGSSTVSLGGGVLAANGSCSFSVNVTGTTAGVKNNSVSVTSTEGGAGNTSNASVTVASAPPPSGPPPAAIPTLHGWLLALLGLLLPITAFFVSTAGRR